MTQSPVISVVVPTHNRSAKLADCLNSLLALEHRREAYEVIVVDAASTDDTAEVVASLAAGRSSPTITYLRNDSRDANAARNAGIARARAELVALVDDDVIVPPGWMQALADGAATHPEAPCLGGPLRPIYECSPPRNCPFHEPAGARFDRGARAQQVSELWGGNMAVRREAFERTGPFREGLPVQQEWEWEKRLLDSGGHLIYLPDAWVWHRRDRSDLGPVVSLRELFLRGYVQAMIGPPVPIPVALSRLRRYLGHAIRARCHRGLAESMRSLGIVCGELARRQRNSTRSWKLPISRPQRRAVPTVQRPRWTDEKGSSGIR